MATNLPTRRAALQAYRRRMWIEELFGDLKGHGFDLERSHLRHFARLSRLTLAVVLVYDWLMTSGTRVIKRGLRSQVDRHDRRDLSIFQIGLRWVYRCLKCSTFYDTVRSHEHDRRDLSIFQIGLRWICRCLKNAQPFTIRFVPTNLQTVG